MRPEVMDRVAAAPRTGLALWVAALGPLLLLGVLLALLVWWDAARVLRGDGYPPVERLTFQQTRLGSQGIVVAVLNDGPDPVRIAQVQVDQAYWNFTANNGMLLNHLGRTTLTIPYPWAHGERHVVRIVSSTGVTFDHEIPVAVETPRPSARFAWLFTLVGVYVGVIPVAIGLLWFPLVSRLGKTGLDFLLALTIGLLLFLLVDALQEGLEAAAGLPAAYQGTVLLAFSATAAYLALETLGRWLRSRQASAAHGRTAGWVLALLVAIGIGLHNFGEGLAIGAAFGLGATALGSLLIIGFTLHNTTEGVAIVAPLARERIRTSDLVTLGAVGGAPTIAGAWVGGFVYSPLWSVAFLAIGAGAIAQVVVQIARQTAGERSIVQYFTTTPVLSGLLAGFIVMYVTGLLVS